MLAGGVQVHLGLPDGVNAITAAAHAKRMAEAPAVVQAARDNAAAKLATPLRLAQRRVYESWRGARFGLLHTRGSCIRAQRHLRRPCAVLTMGRSLCQLRLWIP